MHAWLVYIQLQFQSLFGGDCWKIDYKGRLDTVGEELGSSSKSRHIRTYAKFGCSSYIRSCRSITHDYRARPNLKLHVKKKLLPDGI